MVRALLLDEDPAFGELVSFVVRRMGWKLETCVGLRRALDTLATEAPPPVILLDGSFAKERQGELFEAIAAVEPAPLVVLLAASWREEAPHEGLGALDVARVLHKPIDITVLESDLAEVTGVRPGALQGADVVDADALRSGYRKQLEAAVQTLERAALEEHQRDDDDAPTPAGLMAVLGRLAGTAGSYGYHALSAQARVALSALGQRREAGALEELAWIVRAALSAPPPPLTRIMSTLGPVRWPATALMVGQRPDVVTRVGSELSAHGVEVRFCPTVDEALELAEGYQPDLIVADARLSEEAVDGFPVDEELREGFARAIPMVILGLPDDAAERVRAANAGTTVFVDSDEDGEVLRAAQALAPESYVGIQVMIVDDDPDITDLVTALLAPFGVQVEVAHSPPELWAALERVKPSLILLDIQLPQFDGHALCRTLKAHPGFRDISVVYLTADGRADTKVRAFQNGADDFLVKPVVGQELVAKVLSKLRHQQLAFRRQMTDLLTGALTRAGIEQRAFSLVARPERPPGCGLMLVEVEGLAAIRAEAGILTAERALREASVALEGAVLGRDAIGRWAEIGAEGHFLVLLLGGAPMAFTSAFERARRHLAEHPIFGPEGFFQQISFSVGAAALKPRDSLPAALERARQALASARGEGRSLVVHDG